MHTWIQSVKLQNHSHSLNQVLLHNSDPCSTLPFPLVCDLALVSTLLPDSVHSKLFLWFSSCQVYFHTQAPATKVLSRCCQTIKLFRGYSWVQGETRSTKDLTGGPICLADAYHPGSGKTYYTGILC